MGMELTEDSFAKFVDRLKYHNKGKGVDDHCTANPIFIIQNKERISGIDLDYDPKHYWTDSDHEIELSDEEFKAELQEYVDDGGTHDEFDESYDKSITKDNMILWQKIGYDDRWVYVCAHLTKEGAEAFIKRKAHDYRELRVYVDSQYWCWEFNAIIDGLLSGEIGLIK